MQGSTKLFPFILQQINVRCFGNTHQQLLFLFAV